MDTKLSHLLLVLATGRVWADHVGHGKMNDKFDLWDYKPGMKLVCEYLGVDTDLLGEDT